MKKNNVKTATIRCDDNAEAVVFSKYITEIQLILKSLLRIHIAVEILKELLEDLKEHGWRSGISRYVIQVYIAKVGVIE